MTNVKQNLLSSRTGVMIEILDTKIKKKKRK